MKIELIGQQRMGVEGKGVLRALQNETLPLVDLLVRESIQNSLDATKENEKSTSVDIGIKEFQTDLLANHLEGITDLLLARHQPIEKAIYIRDKNTIGLIGDVRKHEGNIYNLIYTIQRNQEKSGAGGSWGLGKTSYFRAGNGIVLYYTRIKKENGEYEERLAGSLVEDSTKENPLLDNDRGIAWWGEKDQNEEDVYESSYPVTKVEEIHQVLDVFGVSAYEGEDTGTTIIIPFIDEEKLLPQKDNNQRNYWWDNSLEGAIKLAIQKWYAPRISNPMYKGSYLIPSVNGNVLMPEQFEPFFSQVRDLYIYGLQQENSNNIYVEKLRLPRNGIISDQNTAGWISFCKKNEEELSMTPPNNYPHPLEYFDHIHEDDLEKNNAKIIMYTRKPGMIIEYDIDSNWSKQTQSLETEFIIGFFIPNSAGILYEPYQEQGIKTLEDYLRKTEKADHAEWEDIPLNNQKVTIISRIQRDVSKIINEAFHGDEQENKGSKASVLGKKLGEKLLPKYGVGGKTGLPDKNRTKDTKGTVPRKIKSSIDIEILDVDVVNNNQVAISFDLEVQSGISGQVSIELQVGTKLYNESNWLEDMGSHHVYPFKILNVSIYTLNKDYILKDINKLQDDRLSIYASSFGGESSFYIENLSDDKLSIQGKIFMIVHDPLVQPILTAIEVNKHV